MHLAQSLRKLATNPRADRLKAIWLEARCDPHLCAALLFHRYAPTTATSYFAIISKWHMSEKCPEAMRWLQVQTARARPVRANAVPMTKWRAVVTSLATASPSSAATVLMSLLSASRHADLAAMELEATFVTPPTITLHIRLLPHKSDRNGRRHLFKFIEVPRHWSTLVIKLLRQKAWVSYRQVHAALKPFDLTPHSMRRSAITFLAARYDPTQILHLSGHTPAAGAEAPMLRIYIDPHPSQTIPRLQCRMSRDILESLSL